MRLDRVSEMATSLCNFSTVFSFSSHFLAENRLLAAGSQNTPHSRGPERSPPSEMASYEYLQSFR